MVRHLDPCSSRNISTLSSNVTRNHRFWNFDYCFIAIVVTAVIIAITKTEFIIDFTSYGSATFHFVWPKGKDASSRANITQALKLKLFARIVHIRYIANSLTILGLIGTVLGFIIALSGVDPDVASNPSAISPMVAQLIEGMSVALYTTLVGAILSVWLGLIYQMLATGTSNLVSRIIEISES